MANQLTIQIEVIDAEPTQPDPASVSAFADEALADLQARGFTLQPSYTGTLGGDTYEFVRQLAEGAAANKDIVLAMIASIAAPIAGALAERLKQRTAKVSSSQTSPFVVVIVEQAQAEVSEPNITSEELLRRLLASDTNLTQHISTNTKSIVRAKVPRQPKRR